MGRFAARRPYRRRRTFAARRRTASQPSASRTGQITLQGLVTFGEEAGNGFDVAITGGTGAYRTAHGQATITETEEEDVPDQLRLELIR